ncbi:hypothetical protein B0H14DRAFT_3496727 [Mycena olivaceomarginata]|nr:hypothetical protein B0H14DRAFT_3496727 [Mycena olivaceomarginata]
MSCGGVRCASAGRSRLDICSPPPAFPGPPPEHARTSLGAKYSEILSLSTHVRIRTAVQDLTRRLILLTLTLSTMQASHEMRFVAPVCRVCPTPA